MQIVIDIDDSTYEAIEHEYCILPPQKGLLKVLWDAIKNGTPLTPDMSADLLEEDVEGEIKRLNTKLNNAKCRERAKMTMAKMIFDEDGLLEEPCLSCDKAYIEDIWNEWYCDEKECPYKRESEE